MKFNLITIICLLNYYSGITQEFSIDILIDPQHPDSNFRTIPCLSLNSDGELGISWSTEFSDHGKVNFIKSINAGQLFDSLRVLDQGNFVPKVNLIKFDYLNNPIVFYCVPHDMDWSATLYMKKSLNKGLSFDYSLPYFFISNSILNFEYINDTTGLLIYSKYHDGTITIDKTIDGGLTYFNYSQIPGKYSVDHYYSILKCENGDILCFFTGSSIDSTNVFYSRSTDSGLTFSSPVSLDSTFDSANGIFASTFNNNVYIVYYGANKTGERYIIYKKSDDYGNTYSTRKVLHDYSSTSIYTHPSPEIRINKNIGLGIIWGQKEVYFTLSSDFGKAFDSTITLPYNYERYRSRNSMAISDSGDIYVISRIEEQDSPVNKIVLNKSKYSLINSIKYSVLGNINQYTLHQNYPNPFNSKSIVEYEIPIKCYVEISLFNLIGEKIKTIYAGISKSGFNRVEINESDLSSGIYFYALKSNDIKLFKKCILLK